MRSLDASLQAAALRFAAELAQRLRAVHLDELMELAASRPRVVVQIGTPASKPPPSALPRRSEAVAKARVLRAVSELVAEHQLTPQERFILERAAYGAQRAELAAAAKLAQQTMKLKIRGLLRKLEAENLGEISARILHRAASYT